jgi:hypothetical protein
LRKVPWLICIVLTLVAGSLACGKGSSSADPLPGWDRLAHGMARVDKLFPKPPVLVEYEGVRDTAYAGRIAEELPVVTRLAGQAVCLGSDDAWAKDPDIYYYEFTAGRLFPSVAVIRRIWAANAEYADKLGKEGKHGEAIRVLILNLSIARQIVHIQPADMISMLCGHGLWQGTWHELGEQFDAAGDHVRAKRAESCAHQSKVYLRSRVMPVTEYGGRRCAAFERQMRRLPKSRRVGFSREKSLEFIREDSLAAKTLIKQWDAEVDTIACKQLIKELEKMSCLVSTH